MDELLFPPGSVPVAVAAKVFGKDANWVRTGIVMGWLPIGTATRHGKQVTKLYGLCAIPCGTTLWDCESFSSMFVICVDCTHDHIEKFKSIIDNKYPGTYKIKECEE